MHVALCDFDVDVIRWFVLALSSQVDIVIEQLPDIRQHICLVLDVSLPVAVGRKRQAKTDLTRTLCESELQHSESHSHFGNP